MPITTTPSGGPQGEFSTYTPIYATTLSSNTTSVTFSNIPSTFTDLVLVVNGKSVTAGSSANGMRSTFNNDSSALYSETGLSGDGTSTSSYRLSSNTYLNLGNLSQASAGPSANIINIMNYSSTTTNKTVLIRSNNPSSDVGAVVGIYRSTIPITSMTLTRDGSVNIASGTTFTLYGIKAAIPAPKATGGNLVYSDSRYWYHVFNTSGSFIPYTSLTCDYLIVAGGGGSNGTAGGGAGAGGYRSFTSQSLTAQTYPVVVGSGGSRGVPDGATQGGSSSFNGSTSAGGGTGGNHRANGGGNGGSGGGTGGAEGSGALGSQTAGSGNTPSTSPSQGNNGGLVNSISRGGAGGGGAGAVGGSPSNDNGAAGGIGANWLSLGTFYAGGGGGAAQNITSNGTASAGSGGNGGGGNGGGPAADGQPGAFGTGGGAGGGSYIFSGPARPKYGANGGSGVVIVRYLG